MWKQWVNAVLGLAVVALPFLSLSATALTWSLAVAGIIIAVLAIWSTAEFSSPEETRRLAQR
jgi:hypothetical protein